VKHSKGLFLGALFLILNAVTARNAAAQTFPIAFDATALSATRFNINFGAVGIFPNAVATVELSSGGYTFCAPASTDCFNFSVTSAGAVDFDAALDAYVSGRATSTLVVTGFPITINPTALSSTRFNIAFNEVGIFPNAVTNVQVLPGVYTFCAPASTDCFNFSVTSAGAVDFDAALDAYVSGRITSTLVVTGFPITIDATALSAGSFSLSFGEAGTGSTSVVTAFNLIPGSYLFQSGFAFQFFVSLTGTVDYDTFLETVLLGRGTSTLVVLGSPGAPPTCLQLVAGLRSVTDAFDSPMETGLLAILDQLASAIQGGRTNRALALLHAFSAVVDGAVAGEQIPASAGQLIIDRANLIQECLSP
jgi:hypothetical protein